MTRFFEFSHQPLALDTLRRRLTDDHCGGYVAFEGWVRDHNEGRSVKRLEYEAYETLAVKEGERILAEAAERWPVRAAGCVHRVGDLAIGDVAVWVGVSAAHRDEAFKAARYVIDEVKLRVPIWKKEHFTDGDSGWVNCERCAAHAHRHPDAAAATAPDRPADAAPAPDPRVVHGGPGTRGRGGHGTHG